MNKRGFKTNMVKSHVTGVVEVSPKAITAIVSKAVLQCYGVVGVSGKRLRFGAAELLPPSRYENGVDVRLMNGAIVVDIYVILEYGLSLIEISRKAIEDVKAALTAALGLESPIVNIIVRGIRPPNI